MGRKIDELHIRILVDGKVNVGKLMGEAGFAALVDVFYNDLSSRRILFDTGGATPALSHNLEQMEIDISTVDMIILSHGHWDHEPPGAVHCPGNIVHVGHGTNGQLLSQLEVVETGPADQDIDPPAAEFGKVVQHLGAFNGKLHARIVEDEYVRQAVQVQERMDEGPDQDIAQLIIPPPHPVV